MRARAAAWGLGRERGARGSKGRQLLHRVEWGARRETASCEPLRFYGVACIGGVISLVVNLVVHIERVAERNSYAATVRTPYSVAACPG